MRRPERRVAHERPLGRQEPRDGVDPRHLERLVGAERRQQAGEAAGQHRLAGPRRAGEEQVVAAGGRELEGPTGAFLPADVGEVRLGRRRQCRRRRGARTAPARPRPEGTPPPRRDARPVPARFRREPPRAADSTAQSIRSRPARLAPSAAARTPPTGRIRPSRASSPTAAWVARSSDATWCEAPRTASAIGRSKPEPSLRRSAGARFTVMRRAGQKSSAEAMPLRTRCFASWQARSARPTIVNTGWPSSTCASTSTRRASSPTSVWVSMRASTNASKRRTRLTSVSEPRRFVRCIGPTKLYALVLTMIAFPCQQLLPRGPDRRACTPKARRLRTPDPRTAALRSAARPGSARSARPARPRSTRRRGGPCAG